MDSKGGLITADLFSTHPSTIEVISPNQSSEWRTEDIEGNIWYEHPYIESNDDENDFVPFVLLPQIIIFNTSLQIKATFDSNTSLFYMVLGGVK